MTILYKLGINSETDDAVAIKLEPQSSLYDLRYQLENEAAIYTVLNQKSQCHFTGEFNKNKSIKLIIYRSSRVS